MTEPHSKRRSPALRDEPLPEPVVVVPLDQGRSVLVRSVPDGAHLTVRAPSGQALALEVRFEAGGPVVSLSAGAVRLSATEDVSVDCRQFNVRAAEGIHLRTEGDLVQSAGGALQVTGHDVGIEATPGAVRVKANDDVQLQGEMLLLNCDRPAPQPEWTKHVPPDPLASLPCADASGDEDLVEFLEPS